MELMDTSLGATRWAWLYYVSFVVLAVFVGFAACWFFSKPIFAWLSRPLTQFLPEGDKGNAARGKPKPSGGGAGAAVTFSLLGWLWSRLQPNRNPFGIGDHHVDDTTEFLREFRAKETVIWRIV